MSRGERATLVALGAWTLVPVGLMIAHALGAHERLTGADGIIGADQLQYLAWAREAGAHGLASNLFDLSPSGHVFLHPMFTVTGALWRIGLPIQAAYLVWKPVVVVVLFTGALIWVRRLIPEQAGSRTAALVLGLFFYTPLAALAAWTHLGSGASRAHLIQLAGEMPAGSALWGYLPTAMAVGLMPIALLATDRALGPPSDTRNRRGALAVAASAALLVSWLHPWQGVTLILILGGMTAWGRMRGWQTVAVPVIAAAVPLAYYLLLARSDPAWRIASHAELVSRLPLVVVLAGLLPPLLVSAAGIRRPVQEPIERVLVLWLPAALVTYLLVDSFPSHAFESLSLPLAVLLVRGWQRLPLARSLGVLAVIAVTIPGIVYEARELRNVARSPIQEYYLSRSESRALDWIQRHAPPGGVLAAPLFAIEVPSQTGRHVWVGHQFWSRDYLRRASAAQSLFDGTIAPGQARALVAGTGARLVFSDCGHRTDLTGALRDLVSAVARFGCASVYVLKR